LQQVFGVAKDFEKFEKQQKNEGEAIVNPAKICLALIVAASVSLWSQTDLRGEIMQLEQQKKTLQQDIKTLDRNLQKTDSLTKEESRRFKILEQRSATDLERRQQELDSLQIRLKEAASELQREKNKQYSLDLRIEGIKSRREELRRNLMQHCSVLEAQIASGIPWEQEARLDRVRALRRDLENANATAEEGFSRLRAIYLEEIRKGDEVSLLNAPITRTDGEVVNARLLRIGNQWLVYMNDEATKFGVLQRAWSGDSLQYTWKEDLNFEERQAVKLAVDVKSARKPPQLVQLPLSLSLAQTTESSAAAGNNDENAAEAGNSAKENN